MQAIIGALLRELLKKLDADMVKELVDTLLDKVEDKIKASETTWDDITVQPLIDAIRNMSGIDDKKYGSDKE